MSADIDCLLTLRDWVRWGASRLSEAGVFFGHGTDNALDEAVNLVLHAVHLEHDLPPAYLDARLVPAERDAVVRLFRRRIDERIPAAYLTQEARFADLNFYVDERVLVPRSPMAELIESRFAPWVEPDRVERILDLCTGSGCIGIACAYMFPDARIDATDISEPALEVARINVERHGLEDRVRLMRSDLFDALAGDDVYDLVVSNPPYVGREELAVLPEEYRREPALGLESGDEGLDSVSRILADASGHLSPGGIIVVEVGHSAPALAARFPEVPFLWVELERGGEGIFVLTAEQLDRHQTVFESSVVE
ncbi:MAG: 50S ribosomal protein L3 N(5)-glutamine methyltransferase [Chromatiales bacterium]